MKLTQNQLVLTGASKKQYAFNVYPIGEECKDEAGIYLFTKRTLNQQGNYNHTIVYIGMAVSFQSRFYAHHKQSEISKNGANCLCLMQVPNEQDRCFIEKDLLKAYKTTCNEVNN